MRAGRLLDWTLSGGRTRTGNTAHGRLTNPCVPLHRSCPGAGHTLGKSTGRCFVHRIVILASLSTFYVDLQGNPKKTPTIPPHAPLPEVGQRDETVGMTPSSTTRKLNASTLPTKHTLLFPRRLISTFHRPAAIPLSTLSHTYSHNVNPLFCLIPPFFFFFLPTSQGRSWWRMSFLI